MFGFEVERELTVPDQAAAELLAVVPPVGLTAVYLRRGELVLELLSFDRPGNPPWARRVMNEPGLTHLSFSVDDLAAAAASVVVHGGEVVYESLHAYMVRDPDGQLLELLPMSYRDRLPS